MEKAEREFNIIEVIPLNNGENEKAILEEISKNVTNGKERIQKIKEKKIKELIDKYKSVRKDIEERLNNKKELGIPESIQKDIHSILNELHKKSEVPSYWYKVEWRGASSCQIIDKDTKVPIITTDINIVQKIIEDTFGTETSRELKAQADKEWKKIVTINDNRHNGVALERVNIYSCITYLDENRKLVI